MFFSVHPAVEVKISVRISDMEGSSAQSLSFQDKTMNVDFQRIISLSPGQRYHESNFIKNDCQYFGVSLIKVKPSSWGLIKRLEPRPSGPTS